MSVVVVDWLGRGGIAQTADAWARALDDGRDEQVSLLTRRSREVGGDYVFGPLPPRFGGVAAWHGQLVAMLVRLLVEDPPSTLVVQNYHQPVLELPLVRLARKRGCRVILVVHNHKPHGTWTERGVGLRQLVQSVDIVVTHSRFVAADLDRSDTVVIPHPKALSVLKAPVGTAPPPIPGSLRCLQFGVERSYKGSGLLTSLAYGLRDWNMRHVGNGVGASDELVSRRDDFLPPGDLLAELLAADVVVLPYRNATQSGGVALAHAVGVVPVASAVGGIPEQIDPGVDGLLVEDDRFASWAAAVRRLEDSEFRSSLAEAGRRRVDAEHALFVQKVRWLCGAPRARGSAGGSRFST